jgi:hypothetical protein
MTTNFTGWESWLTARPVDYSLRHVDGAHTVADSHEWEQLCKQLLALRYGAEVQLIDATRDGDLGLEAFTRSSALGFQCYAPLEPLSAKDRYEKHRDKLTSDLAKLEANQAKLAVLFGTMRLRQYILMVPHFDTRLLEHCGTKRNEFRAKALPILADDFEVSVQTEADYPVERAQLIEVALAPLALDVPDIDQTAREQWEEAHVPLVETLTEKLRTFNLSEEKRIELRDEFLRHYLRREQLLDQVFAEAPETHVRLERRIRQREQLLASARLLSGQPPIEHVQTVVASLTQELRDESRALQPAAAEAIAYGTAADWMVRCPLDFDAVA